MENVVNSSTVIERSKMLARIEDYKPDDSYDSGFVYLDKGEVRTLNGTKEGLKHLGVKLEHKIDKLEYDLNKNINQKINLNYSNLYNKIDLVNDSLKHRIDLKNDNLNHRIGLIDGSLNHRIDLMDASINQRLDDLHKLILNLVQKL